MAIRKPFFVLPVPLSGLASDTADSGHPVDNLARLDAIGLTWQSGASGSTHWVRGQFSSASIDFCSVIAANAVAGTDIRLRLGTSQAQVDGTAPYDSDAVDFISPMPAPEPRDGLYHSHLELDASESASWFRIDISSHTGAFEASSIVLGKKIEPSRFYNLDFEFGVEDLGSGKFTPWGVWDEDPGVVLRTIDFALAWQTQDEFEDSFRPMIEGLGTRGFVYLCFDPEDNARRQAKTYLGVLKKPGFARGTRKPGYVQEFSILSII